MTRKKQHYSYDGGPVGYKKPPAEHQFQKGGKKPATSGRSAGSKNSRTFITEMLDELVTVSLTGETKTMNKKELMIRVCFEKAIKANSVREALLMLRVFEKLAPDSMDPPLPIRVRSIPGDEGL